MMGRIVFDERGTFRKDLFYQFHVPFLDEPFEPDPTIREELIVSKRTPTNDELSLTGKPTYLRVESVGSTEGIVKYHQCRVDNRHVTRQSYRKHKVDLLGGPRLSEFIPDTNDLTIITERFAKRWEQMGFQGAALTSVKVNVDQNGKVKSKLFLLEFTGRNCSRVRTIVDGPNECPFCGYAPAICGECGFWPFRCIVCDRDFQAPAVDHRGKSDKRLVTDIDANWLKRGEILDGRRWDGSDLVNCNDVKYISRRVLDWLLATHAAPFFVRPVRFCIDALSAKQKKQLHEIQRPT